MAAELDHHPNERPAGTGPVRIAISISTLHRAEGLARTLESLAQQQPSAADPFLLCAVVVNNDPQDPTPRQAAIAVAERTGMAVAVHDEPQRGIAPPRNRGLAVAREIVGDRGLIGFIDDDEIAPAGWLAELLKVKREHRADIVTGPVEPRFEEAPPRWVARGGFFARQSFPTGSARPWAFTNNILFDASLLARLDRWFDDSFLRLGEDRHFFARLARSGARIAWANDAAVIESIDPRRTTAAWLVSRLRTVGRCVPLIERDLHGPWRANLVCLCKAAVWIPLGGATTIAGILGGTAMRVRGRRWIAYGFGLVEGVCAPSRGGRPARSDH